jgi:RND superfamily putative drug exporter
MADLRTSTTPPGATGRLARLAELAFRRRGRFVLAWIVGLVLIAAGGGALAGEYDAEYSTPGSESDDAATLIESRFEDSSSETIDVVWEAPQGATSPEIKRRVDAFLGEAAKLEGIGGVDRPRVSRDGTIAMQSLQLTERAWDVPVETGEEMISLSGPAATGCGSNSAAGRSAMRRAAAAPRRSPCWRLP